MSEVPIVSDPTTVKKSTKRLISLAICLDSSGLLLYRAKFDNLHP